MTERMNARLFMDEVYHRIRHGDEAHRQWLRDMCSELVPELEKRLSESESRLKAENERLKGALEECIRAFEQTHANYCSSAWTDRGLHASECLLYEAEDAQRALSTDKQGPEPETDK